MYFLIRFLLSITASRKCRLRLPVLWLSRCFLPACRRFNLPVAVTRKRFLLALWVFISGMAVSEVNPTYRRRSNRNCLKEKGPLGKRLEVPCYSHSDLENIAKLGPCGYPIEVFHFGAS